MIGALDEPTRVKVTVRTDGTVVTEVQGMKGEGCKALTAGLEKALGVVVSDVDTAEAREEGPLFGDITEGQGNELSAGL